LKDFYDAFGTPHTVFVETDPALHKIRRKLLNPFFSKSGLLKLEAAMKVRVQNLREKMITLADQGKVINAYCAFRCVTADVISEYAFARSLDCLGHSDDQFYNEFLKTFDAVANVVYEVAFSPVARKVGMAIPKPIAAALSKELRLLFQFGDLAAQSLDAWKKADEKPAHPVIFDGLTSVDDEQAIAEAVDILAAGSDTTAFSLSVGMWNIAHNAAIKQKLVEALKRAIPDINTGLPSTATLESIPYLQACIKESIRVAQAVPGRLPRIVPTSSTPLIVDNKIVPAGTVVGMSTYTMHNDETFWGLDARIFNPDRWLAPGAKSLDEQFAAFSKGARSCIGQNLAFMEASIVLAMMYRYFEVNLTKESSRPLRSEDKFTSTLLAPAVLLEVKSLDE
jgi:cytochrome P450